MSTDETMNEAESLRYINMHIARQNALGDTLIILARLEATTFDATEKLRLVIARRPVEDEYAANEQEFLAFCDDDLAVHPPTTEQVDAIVKLAGELAVLTQKKTKFVAVMALTKSVLSQVMAIRNGA